MNAKHIPGTRGVLCLSVILFAVTQAMPGHAVDAGEGAPGFSRVKYNQSGLVVDLGVGLWASPFVFDMDGDGKQELCVLSSGPQYGGLFVFKRSNSADPFAPLSFAFKIEKTARPTRVSKVGREIVVTSTGKKHPDFRKAPYEEVEKIPFKPDFYIGKQSQWSYFDYDGDGVEDLIIGVNDPRDYGWIWVQGATRPSFDAQGRWLHGAEKGFVYWVKNEGTNGKPKFSKAERIMAGDRVLEVKGNPSPCLADFDGDGLFDIICGSGTDEMTLFRNIGTKRKPKFAGGEPLSWTEKTAGMDLCMIQPAVADWDGDGKPDLIVGEEDGRVAVLINAGSKGGGSPRFFPPKYLKQIADEVKVGVLNVPSSFDWNGDGLQDIIQGDSAGYVIWVENLGGNPPKWAEPRKLEANGRTIRIQADENGSLQGPGEKKWGYTNVCVADWDGDGLPDLLLNSIFGKIVWYQNIGTRTRPRLGPEQPVKVAWPGDTPKPSWLWWNPKPGELVVSWRSGIQAIDLNGDGLLDMVTLDRDGFLVLLERAKDFAGKLVLLPPKRVFRMEPGSDSVFNIAHQPLSLSASRNTRINDLAGLDSEGKLAFYGWEPEEADGPRGDNVITAREDRSHEPRDKELEAEGPAIRLNAGWGGRSGRRNFVLVDWNGDGRLDLLVNSLNVNFLENVSQKPGEFVFRDKGPLDGIKLAGHLAAPAIVDWNKDGIPDLVVGTEDGYLYYFQNPRRQATREDGSK